jgi:hypothetical protein
MLRWRAAYPDLTLARDDWILMSRFTPLVFVFRVRKK